MAQESTIPPEKLRIALVCDWYLPRIGGIEMHLKDLALSLKAHGHDVEIITPIPGPSVDDGIRIHRIQAPLLPFFKVSWRPKTFSRLRDQLHNGGYDVVHIHVSVVAPFAYAGIYHCKNLQLPSLVTTHSIYEHFIYFLYGAERLFHWTHWPIRYSSVSTMAAKQTERLLAGKPFRILPNGIHEKQWKMASRPFASRTIHITSVMRLIRKKRPFAFIRILDAVFQKLPPEYDVKVHIIGGGPDHWRLQRMIRRLDLSERVFLLGNRSRAEIQKQFENTSFFVLPSIQETFGIAALEARSAGLPIVAMKTSGVADFICHEKEGLLAEDDQDLIDNIQRLIQDETLRDQITQNNWNTSPKEDWENVSQLHISEYKETIMSYDQLAYPSTVQVK
jgi:glycosyltransferase involved in cell wall biosynthesis